MAETPKGGGRVEVKDVLTLMVDFGSLILGIATFAVTLFVALNQNKRK
nr:putative holin-like toxin [Paenibacillus phyllosphaerae]